jgi:hypothetical protein
MASKYGKKQMPIKANNFIWVNAPDTLTEDLRKILDVVKDTDDQTSPEDVRSKYEDIDGKWEKKIA